MQAPSRKCTLVQNVPAERCLSMTHVVCVGTNWQQSCTLNRSACGHTCVSNCRLDEHKVRLPATAFRVVKLQRNPEDLLAPFEIAIDEDAEEHAGNDEGEEADAEGDVKAVYIKDVAKNLLLPELQAIRELAEDAWSVIQQEKRVHLVLQLDGTSYRSFKDLLVKLEQVVVAIVLEGSESAQQSSTWCQPLGFMQGDASLHAAFETRAAWSCAAHESDRI
jgi:hypothetical protein